MKPVIKKFGNFEAKSHVLYYLDTEIVKYNSSEDAIKAAKRWHERYVKYHKILNKLK